MSMDIYTKNNKIKLDSRDFLAKGGQAEIFLKDNLIYKIYHDINQMIPEAKIRELQAIKNKHVLKPIDVVYNHKNKAIGYMMNRAPASYTLCQLFTKSFKNRHKIGQAQIIRIISDMQTILQSIHDDNCLVVDLNELNIMISSDFKSLSFLDVDSYQTQSFKANALMDSISDPLVKNNQFSIESDWYSWGILAFNLYVGVHPFKGKHPRYKKNEWLKRKAEHASVFDDGVRLPAACSDFSIIPDEHLVWFKDTFQAAKRYIPPVINTKTNVLKPITKVRKINSNKGFIIKKRFEFPDIIHDSKEIFGVLYTLTENALYRNDRQIVEVRDKSRVNNIFFINGDAFILTFSGFTKEVLIYNDECEIRIQAESYFIESSRLYTILFDQFFEQHFHLLNGQLNTSKRSLSRCNFEQLKVFTGLLIQRTIDQIIVFIPYAEKHLYKAIIPELLDFRVLDAKYEKHFLIIIAEKSGVYYRIIIK